MTHPTIALSDQDHDIEKTSSIPSTPTRMEHIEIHDDPKDALHRLRTTGSVSMSPQLFEKLYLSPQNAESAQGVKKYGNPTPLALAGFLLSLTPLSCTLMGWNGAGGSGVANIGVFYFMGGFLMSVGGILEFFLGNTFPFVVFTAFGGFWFAFAATLTPSFNAITAFSPHSNAPTFASGLENPQFYNTYAFFFLFMAVLCFCFLICSIRTNICFVGIFTGLVIAFPLLAGSYWYIGAGNAHFAGKLTIAAGAITFVVDLLGWWVFLAVMLVSVDFPIGLPVGDLSGVVRGGSERLKKD